MLVVLVDGWAIVERRCMGCSLNHDCVVFGTESHGRSVAVLASASLIPVVVEPTWSASESHPPVFQRSRKISHMLSIKGRTLGLCRGES